MTVIVPVILLGMIALGLCTVIWLCTLFRHKLSSFLFNLPDYVSITVYCSQGCANNWVADRYCDQVSVNITLFWG